MVNRAPGAEAFLVHLLGHVDVQRLSAIIRSGWAFSFSTSVNRLSSSDFIPPVWVSPPVVRLLSDLQVLARRYQRRSFL